MASVSVPIFFHLNVFRSSIFAGLKEFSEGKTRKNFGNCVLSDKAGDALEYDSYKRKGTKLYKLSSLHADEMKEIKVSHNYFPFNIYIYIVSGISANFHVKNIGKNRKFGQNNRKFIGI